MSWYYETLFNAFNLNQLIFNFLITSASTYSSVRIIRSVKHFC